MDRNLALEAIRVSEAAALASAGWMGRGDAVGAKKAAGKAMRNVIDSIYFKGIIVIGSGERTERSHLSAGSVVGYGNEPVVDVAVDPLESIESVAFGRTNAMAVIAMAPAGQLMKMPEMYMEKIAVGPEAAGLIDMDLPIEENLKLVAEAKGYALRDLTVVLLDRDRHAELIERLRKLRVRLHLIPDGDVSAAIACSLPGTGIDVLVGSGGAPEGVLAAAALRCVGGEMLARLLPEDQAQRDAAKRLTLGNPDHVFCSADMARGDSVMFAATGVTDGDLLNGVRFRSDGATTHSLVLRSQSRTRRFIVTEHYFEDQPSY